MIDDKLNRPDPPPEKKDGYLSRLEVATLLKISLPTLNDWTKTGLLQSYKIANRVLYKSIEVENALHKVTNIKYKKGSNHGL